MSQPKKKRNIITNQLKYKTGLQSQQTLTQRGNFFDPFISYHVILVGKKMPNFQAFDRHPIVARDFERQKHGKRSDASINKQALGQTKAQKAKGVDRQLFNKQVERNMIKDLKFSRYFDTDQSLEFVNRTATQNGESIWHEHWGFRRHEISQQSPGCSVREVYEKLRP